MTKKRLVTQKQLPAGLFYLPEFLSLDDEAEVLAVIEELPFEAYVMGSYIAKRTVVQFGAENYRGNYAGNQALEHLPDWLLRLRVKCAALIQPNKVLLEQALIARYENAGIGWHRDAPQFGPVVIGVSFGSPNIMRFRRIEQQHEALFRLELAPRSVYIMSGESRAVWQHSMPECKGLRFSATFRTLNQNLNTETSLAGAVTSDNPTMSMVTDGKCSLERERCLQPESIAKNLNSLGLLRTANYNIGTTRQERVSQLSFLKLANSDDFRRGL